MQTPEAVERFDVFSWEQTAVRGMEARQKGMHLIGVSRDTRAIYADSFTETPSAVEKRVARANLTATAEFYAETQGFTLVRYSDSSERAVFARPLPAVTVVRDAIARELKVPAYSVAVIVDWSDSEPRAERVLVRLPATNIAEERRSGVLTEVLRLIPGSSSGWTVETDAYASVSAFVWGAPPELPPSVPLTDVLPDCVTPEDWAFSAFGKNASGASAGHRLTLAPHTMLGGAVGTGKTSAITTMVAGRLMRGHDIIIIDPVKGVDFEAFRPFARYIAETYDEAVAAMQWLLEEAERRKAVLKKHKAVKWYDLTPEQLSDEGIKPLTIVIDEVGQLFHGVKPNQMLAKDDPLRVKQETLAQAKAIIDASTGEIARAYRFVGLFLIIATQKLLVSMLGTNGSDLRTNCGNGVFLHAPGSVLERGDLSLLFDSSTDRAIEQLQGLDDGFSIGLAATAAEGAGLSAVRVAYAPPREVEPLLRERGVPLATPLALSAATTPTPAEPVNPWG